MKATVRLREGLSFEGLDDNGHSLITDSSAESGGKNAGFRPMSLVLIGTGACTADNVVSMLRKMRQDVTGCTVELDSERADEAPKYFTRVHMRFTITGKALDPAKVERAMSLSVEKYCSATTMLSRTAEITHEYEIAEG